MATYAGALTVAAAAYAYAKRHASNRRFSFGTGKVGDLAGFASALILGVVALGIAFESVQRLMNPRPVAFGQATVVAVVGLAGSEGYVKTVGPLARADLDYFPNTAKLIYEKAI